MRSDDDLGFVAWDDIRVRGAQAASLLFAAACREPVGVAAPQIPNPPIISIRLRDSRIPRVARDIEKFLLQITFGPDRSIKRFRLPNSLGPLLNLVNSSGGEGLDAV